MKRISFLLLMFVAILFNCLAQSNVEMSGEMKKWHKVTLTFNGPETSETDKYNPFMNYRLNVTFSHPKTREEYVVPGYFAADADAGNTSAEAGNKWKVHFAPDEIGEWNYTVDFRKGKWVAVSDRINPGVSGEFMDKMKGSFTITETDKTGRDFRARGRLQYTGGHYLKLAENGEYFLKAGADAPENFLSYVDFDGTFHNDGHKDHFVKTWEPHLQDWKKGDPTWKKNKGKAIIGALNYLASEELNAVSFLTLNIGGDDQNVFPFINYDTYDRYDISKLDQWEVVFSHAQKNGLFLHFKTQEMENQGLLDNGGVGAHRKLYYRELIARFGHHLALNWNLGEEIGDWVKNHKTPPQFKWQRLSMAAYFYDHDPYNHHVVIHNGNPFYDILGPNSAYTGVSVQTHRRDFGVVHEEVLKWRKLSAASGKAWAVACDEPGDASYSLVPDKDDPDKRDARVNALWGTFLAGGWGVEWYFGYKADHSDLTCQDWRSRDLFWDQCRHALHFFRDNDIPYWKMEPNDDAISGENFCITKGKELFVGMIKEGTEETVELRNITGKFSVLWFNPKTGGELQKGSVEHIEILEIDKEKRRFSIGSPPKAENNDWVVLIRKE